MKLTITNHSIDRASIRFIKLWRARCKFDEGVASWLHRAARSALHNGTPHRETADDPDKLVITHRRITFVFSTDQEPDRTLLTVYSPGEERPRFDRSATKAKSNRRIKGSRIASMFPDHYQS